MFKKGRWMIKNMLGKIKKIIPASVKNAAKKLLGRDEAKNSDIIPYIRKNIKNDIITILDVGCGRLWDNNPKSEDILFSLFDSPQYKITGIDIFEDCISWRKKNGPAGEYLTMDAKNLKDLPSQFDVVIAHHILEHFPKDESVKLLELIEKKAGKQVIIGTPIGFTNTEYAVKLHNNENERHLCAWYPEEFEKRGYDVFKIKNVLLAVKNV